MESQTQQMLIGLGIALAIVVALLIVFRLFIWTPEHPESKKARRMIEICQDMQMELDLTPYNRGGNNTAYWRSQVDHWILSAMQDQLFVALDGPTDISKATSIMASAIPMIMVNEARAKCGMSTDELKARYAELREQVIARADVLN